MLFVLAPTTYFTHVSDTYLTCTTAWFLYCRIVTIYEMAYKLVTAQLFIKVLTQNKNRVYEICPCQESSRKNKCCGLFRNNFDYEEPISLSIVSFVRKSYVMKRNYYPIIMSFINFFNSKFGSTWIPSNCIRYSVEIVEVKFIVNAWKGVRVCTVNQKSIDFKCSFDGWRDISIEVDDYMINWVVFTGPCWISIRINLCFPLYNA